MSAATCAVPVRYRGRPGSSRAPRTPRAQRQSLEEIAQHLVAAQAEILVVGLAEKGRQFRLGNREAGVRESLVHVDVLELEGDTELLQHHVVGDTFFHRSWRQALVLSAAVEDQSIEEMGEDPVAALDVGLVVVLLQEGLHVFLRDGEGGVRQFDDLHDPGVAEVEHVADAAQYVVVDHWVPCGAEIRGRWLAGAARRASAAAWLGYSLAPLPRRSITAPTASRPSWSGRNRLGVACSGACRRRSGCWRPSCLRSCSRASSVRGRRPWRSAGYSSAMVPPPTRRCSHRCRRESIPKRRSSTTRAIPTPSSTSIVRPPPETGSCR